MKKSTTKLPEHPAEFLRKNSIDRYNLSMRKTAQILGVGRARLKNLLSEKTPLKTEMAFRFELAFGISMEESMAIQIKRTVAETNIKYKDLTLPSLHKPGSQSP